MELLAELRKHILNSPLKIKADNLLTFANDGQITSHQGDLNGHFSIRYDAKIIVTDYTDHADMLFFIVLQWLAANNANHATTPIRFNADIIDHKTADVELILTLEENVGANLVEGGMQLVHNGVKPIDICPLSATNWELYIHPDPDPVASWLESGE
jgi:hypothetical protein